MDYKVRVVGELKSKGRPSRWLPRFLHRAFTWTRRWPVDWVIRMPAADGHQVELLEVGPFEVYLMRAGFLFEISVRAGGAQLLEVRLPATEAGPWSRPWSFNVAGQAGRGVITIEEADDRA